jgi:tRNA 2-thiouridine synthesizing protein A
MADQQLDVRRLLCPIPVIRTQNQVQGMKTGQVLEVVATDPGTLNDIPAWCRINGHEVLGTGQDRGEIRIRIRVGEDDSAL